MKKPGEFCDASEEDVTHGDKTHGYATRTHSCGRLASCITLKTLIYSIPPPLHKTQRDKGIAPERLLQAAVAGNLAAKRAVVFFHGAAAAFSISNSCLDHQIATTRACQPEYSGPNHACVTSATRNPYQHQHHQHHQHQHQHHHAHLHSNPNPSPSMRCRRCSGCSDLHTD